MEKIKLTKREYIKEGYSDTIKNLKTGEFITTLCTKENYEDVDFPDVPKGFEYISSGGGFPLLDTGMGKVDEFFIKDDEYYVYEIDNQLGGITTLNKYSQEEFNNKYIWQ